MLTPAPKNAPPLSPAYALTPLDGRARMIHTIDVLMCLKIGEHGAPLLPQGGVLTHCNAGARGDGHAVRRRAADRGRAADDHVANGARHFVDGAAVDPHFALG